MSQNVGFNVGMPNMAFRWARVAGVYFTISLSSHQPNFACVCVVWQCSDVVAVRHVALCKPHIVG